MKVARLLVCLFAFGSALALGQDQNAPHPELNKLSWQLGTWEGNVKWSMPGMDDEMTMAWTSVMDGNFMKSTSTMDMMGQKVTETGYLTWDAKQSRYSYWTFTNFAHMPRVEHGTLDGDKMVMISEPWDAGMGEATVSRATVAKKGDTELTFLLEFKQGETWNKVAEGTFKKKV